MPLKKRTDVIRNLDAAWPDPDGVWGDILAIPRESPKLELFQ